MHLFLKYSRYSESRLFKANKLFFGFGWVGDVSQAFIRAYVVR